MEVSRMLLLFFLLLTIMILYEVLIKNKDAIEKEKNADKEITDHKIETSHLEELFFLKINSGLKGIRIASLYSYYDIMFIKSFLQSAEIPCFFEFESMNTIYGGIPIYGNANIFLNILEEDYEDVIELLEEFENTKQEMEQKENNKLHKMLGIILGWNVPISHLRTIKIYYKEHVLDTKKKII